MVSLGDSRREQAVPVRHVPGVVTDLDQAVVVVDEDDARLELRASASSIAAYAMMMTVSPGEMSRAAAPLMQTMPVPRSPSIA